MPVPPTLLVFVFLHHRSLAALFLLIGPCCLPFSSQCVPRVAFASILFPMSPFSLLRSLVSFVGRFPSFFLLRVIVTSCFPLHLYRSAALSPPFSSLRHVFLPSFIGVICFVYSLVFPFFPSVSLFTILIRKVIFIILVPASPYPSFAHRCHLLGVFLRFSSSCHSYIVFSLTSLSIRCVTFTILVPASPFFSYFVRGCH